MPPFTLTYKDPAKEWSEALPIGNGKLGAMVFGGVNSEELKLNEDTVWYSGRQNREPKDAFKHLAQLRQLIRQGELSEAEDLLQLAFFASPASMRHYEPLGNAMIDFLYPNDATVKSYHRKLDLTSATVSVEYQMGDCRYKRTIICSYPANAIIMHIECSVPQDLNFNASISRLGEMPSTTCFFDSLDFHDDKTLLMTFNSGGNNGACAMGLKTDIRANTSRIGSNFIVRNATSATIVWSASTIVRKADPAAEAIAIVRDTLQSDFSALLEAHITDYKALYGRLKLEMGWAEELTVPELLALSRKQSTVDPYLAALYCQFGRYLLISCSRTDKDGYSMPANLQGIWCPSFDPPWGSKFTININTQMNYWPANLANLSICEEPLFELVERMAVRGRHTAKVMYNCGGWVAHHNTDLWADTAPQDKYLPATVWVLSGPWLCLHFWEHYLYTGDLAIAKRAYPLIRGSVEFFMDFLVPDAQGYMVTSPSVSPENTYILPGGAKGVLCEGPTIDNQILHTLFTVFEKLDHLLKSEIDNYDKTFTESVSAMKAKLPPMKVGSKGQLLEWQHEYDEWEPGHRHTSHLWGLYPGCLISKHTPDLAQASKMTLINRATHGGGHTGWSRAWLINLWARLGEGDVAESHVQKLLASSTMDNMFDVHPPFQIDGNFGGSAGILEMLIQSHSEHIQLLPALPASWKDGTIAGVCARGGFEFEFTWEDGKVVYPIKVTSRAGNKCKVIFASKTKPKSPHIIENSSYVVEIETTVGGTYLIN